MIADWKIQFITEIDRTTGDHVRYIKFPLDGSWEDNDSWCYRSRRSHNAFFGGCKERNWAPTCNRQTANRLYHWQSLADKLAHEEIWKEVMEGSSKPFVSLFQKIPVIELNSIWEFYEYAGWDYKKKRWLK